MTAYPVHQPLIDVLKAELAYERGRADALSESVRIMAQALAAQRVPRLVPPPPPPPPPPQPQRPHAPAPRALPPPPPAPPLVYFIQAGEAGPIKIGCSRSPAVRLQELQTGNAEPLRYCGSVPGGRELEQQLHERFAAFRISGEWFHAEPELVDYIRSVTGQPPRTTP